MIAPYILKLYIKKDLFKFLSLQYSTYIGLGNLPVNRAKDAVCFLQWCGVSLVSSYTMCFLQRGGVSLASSAIIYNIVKVEVSHWPVDRPLFRKRTPQGPPTYLHCGAELCFAAHSAACQLQSKRRRCSVWREAGAYII